MNTEEVFDWFFLKVRETSEEVSLLSSIEIKMQMKKFIRIKQRDISDCGAACLASVSSYYGLHLPVSRIREYAGTGRVRYELKWTHRSC